MRFDTGCARRTVRRDGSRKYQSAYVSPIDSTYPLDEQAFARTVSAPEAASGSRAEFEDKGVKGDGFLNVAAEKADQFVHLADGGANPVETDP